MMRNTHVFFRLKNIKDPKEIAYDGITIEGRMQELIRMTEGEIKQCTNACDTFHKKKVLGSNVPFFLC